MIIYSSHSLNLEITIAVFLFNDKFVKKRPVFRLKILAQRLGFVFCLKRVLVTFSYIWLVTFTALNELKAIILITVNFVAASDFPPNMSILFILCF